MRAVIFKEQHWLEYSSGQVIGYDKGFIANDLPELERNYVIENGYAKEIEVGKAPDNLTPPSSDRSSLYETQYTLGRLKDLCTANGIKLKPSLHRTKPDIIQLILEYEKNNNIDLLKDNNA